MSLVFNVLCPFSCVPVNPFIIQPSLERKKSETSTVFDKKERIKSINNNFFISATLISFFLLFWTQLSTPTTKKMFLSYEKTMFDVKLWSWLLFWNYVISFIKNINFNVFKEMIKQFEFRFNFSKNYLN